MGEQSIQYDEESAGVSDVAEDAPEVEKTEDAATTEESADSTEAHDDGKAVKDKELTEDEKKEAENAEIRDRAFKLREAKREAAEERQRNEELQKRLNQYEAPIRPDIPPPPDPYDDNYQEKVRQRDAMIARAAQFDAQSEIQRQNEQRQQENARREQQEKLNTSVKTYSSKAEKLGISADELRVAGSQIAPLMNDRLAMRILRDDQGPEITTYLARNIRELDTLAGMEPEDAAVYLETVVKPKARRKPSKLPPEPTEHLSGASMREGGIGPEGATYE